MEKQMTWDVVEEQKKINKMPRINWKAILGMSLTRAIARFKTAGLTAELTYKTLCFEHPELTQEMKRRMYIGICARFGEMNTAQSELRRGRNYPDFIEKYNREREMEDKKKIIGTIRGRAIYET